MDAYKPAAYQAPHCKALCVNYPMNKLLKESNQLWKASLSFSSLLAGMVSVCLGLYFADSLSYRVAFTMIVLSSFISLTTLVWGAVSIKCPSCGSRWLWDSLSKQEMDSWSTHFWTLKECPNCGKSKFE